MTSRNSAVRVSSLDIVKQGYLKKLKTMKKKYFVLRRDSADVPARLEYYDSEKKFKTNLAPKRSITLKTCFNINKPSDTRQKYVIALFTKKDRFCIVFNNEEEMEDWLKVLLELQHEGNLPAGEPVRPNFEQVWQVIVLSKDLGQKANILGPHCLCLTDQTLSLVKLSMSHADQVDAIKFSFQNIRSCGNLDYFFYLELGQCTVTGAGQLWMQTEDNNIAKNMHDIIKNILEISEDPKPVDDHKLKQAITENISDDFQLCGPNHNNYGASEARAWRKKDLQPKSRNRSSSANEASKPVSLMQRWPTHTVSSGSGSGGGSGPVNHQRTYSFPLSPVPPTRRASTGTRPTKCITSTSPQSSLTGVRERSDSMPSRARTTSECAPPHMHPPRYVTTPPYRPHSMYNKGVSYSPPVGSSPVSPASAACSMDSAGSSLSMDGDSTDCPWDDQGRYGHSLTPDEPAILEENPDDSSPWIGEDEKLNNYMPMDTNYCLPVQTNTNFNSSIYRKYSPNPSFSGFKSSSPSQASYMEMSSPCGSSPMDTPGNYLPMSPGENRTPHYSKNFGNHSRGSSLAEDGYVPMAPGASDDGYVDMDHGPKRNKLERYQSGDLSTGSSCSVTSGTPSTDFRFNEYPLDKVPSCFTHEEDITPAERPARAYSVGSRPTFNNNRSEISATSSERTRAFSVGSKNVRIINHMRMLMHNPPTHTSSHSSMEPSDDMMELDFSKKGRMKSRKKPSSSERLSVPGGSASTLSSVASSYSTAEGSYMDMSLPCSSNSASIAPSPPKPSRFAALLGKSPPKPSLQEVHALSKGSPPVSGYPSPSLGRVPETEPGYVEMTVKSDPQSTSPSEQCLCMTHSASKDDAYVEMKPGQIEAKQIIATNVKARIDSFPPNDHQKVQSKSHRTPTTSQNFSKEDYYDVTLKRKIPLVEDNNNSKLIIGRASSPSDYVVMDLGGKSPSSNFVESKQDNVLQDYMNMSYKKEDKKKTRRDARYSSQPITIQSSAKDLPNPVYSIAGRKHSTGTSPKVPLFLPLGGSGSPSSSPYSTLGRSRHKETIRKDNYTGPFSFILHSPSDSMDCYEQSPKVPVDGTSGTLKISYSETNLLEKRSEPKIIQESSDYVDYQPCTCISTPTSNVNTSRVDDYVPMAPAATTSATSKPSRKTSAPSLGARIRPIEKLLSGLGSSFSTLSMSSTPIVTLPPSPVKSESETLVGDDAAGFSDEEGEGTASKSGNSDSSRKSSVTSVGNKEIHYASLDLVVRSGGGIESEELNRNLNTQTSLTETSSTSIPSPNLSTVDTTFNYAEIDFAKSGSSTQKTIH